VLLAQLREAVFDDRPSRPSKNVTDKKNFQDSMVSR
jgi:hypothetical protein